MSTSRQYLSEANVCRGSFRSHSEQSEFRREFWQYISMRSKKHRGQTATIENSKRSQWFMAQPRASTHAGE
ncbi:MAG: hypothetical protein SGI98_09260 [Verrucomicrobiota bacterium]|nr:hypothetical protein [Verrucomicrobiota bacterium]